MPLVPFRPIASFPGVFQQHAGLDNATDELYHNHLNYLKDLAPEIGRNFKLLYSVKF